MPKEIICRPATTQDVPQMSDLHRLVPYVPSYYFSPKYLMEDLFNIQMQTIVATQNNKEIVGMISFTVSAAPWEIPEILCLVIKPSATGMGRVLLRQAEEILIHLGYTTVALHPNNPNTQSRLEEWYAHQGYKPNASGDEVWKKDLTNHPEQLIHEIAKETLFSHHS